MNRLGMPSASKTKPLATAFLRYVVLRAVNADPRRGGIMKAAMDAQSFAQTTPEVERLLCAATRGKINLDDYDQFVAKTAVAPGTTTATTWAGPLLEHQSIMAQFLEVLRPATILGQLTTRPQPFNSFAVQQTTGAIAHWVGEGVPIPLSAEAFTASRLDPLRLAVIVAISRELQKFADPAALAELQSDLIRACAQALNASFIDPSLGATATHPASITHGVTPRHSTGSSVTQVLADLKAAPQSLIDAGSTLASAKWILTPTDALFLSALHGTNGEIVFPDITIRGGELLGLPVIVSAASVPSGSPGERTIALVDGDRILVADAGIIVDTSQNASLQLSDTPTDPATSTVSLWQSDLVAVRVQRIINWRAMPDAVALIDNVVWQ